MNWYKDLCVGNRYQGQWRVISVGCNYLSFPLIPGPWFNIKMLSNQYRKSHCGDKTVVRSSYLHNGISYTGKTSFYIESGPCFLHPSPQMKHAGMYSLCCKVMLCFWKLVEHWFHRINTSESVENLHEIENVAQKYPQFSDILFQQRFFHNFDLNLHHWA